MAHLVEGMMYTGQTPWHGLGIKLEDNPSIEQAIVAAGLDWKVSKSPLITQDTMELVDHFATKRSNDGKLLGVVGPNYVPLQNIEAFDWFKPFLESKECSIHTAGSLKDGQKVWVLAKLNRDPLIIGKDDTVDKYILLSNSHDGTTSVRVGFTPIRVVCNNTLTLAHSEGTSNLIRVRHGRNTITSLDDIRNVMNTVNASFEATSKEYYSLLANTSIDSKTVKQYIKTVLSMGEKDEDMSTRSKNTLELVTGLFDQGQGNHGKTFWDAYNGITEYLSYHKGRTNESRIGSLWFGINAQLNQSALDVAVDMCKAA